MFMPTQKSIPPSELSPKERRIIKRICNGLSQDESAANLGIPVGTLSNNISLVYVKLRIRGPVALTHWAIKNKLVKLGDCVGMK